MNFNLEEAIEVLERTPRMLEALLSGLSDNWLQCNEGEDTWNAAEVVEHLIEGEKYNWLPRLETILQDGEQPFPPFDRFSHMRIAERPMEEKLLEFRTMRERNVAKLRQLIDAADRLESTGLHPAFGAVKARELIATWVVHDLTHTAQIVRVMAHRYRADVGPWIAYLGILNK